MTSITNSIVQNTTKNTTMPVCSLEYSELSPKANEKFSVYITKSVWNLQTGQKLFFQPFIKWKYMGGKFAEAQIQKKKVVVNITQTENLFFTYV